MSQQISDRYSLRPRGASSLHAPSNDDPDLPPSRQGPDRDTQTHPPVDETLGTLHSLVPGDGGTQSHRVWSLTANRDVGRKETDNGEWMIKTVTLDQNNIPSHRVEKKRLSHDTTFWLGDPAKGHHVYTEEYDGWTFYGVNLNAGQAASSANQEVITSTEAGS